MIIDQLKELRVEQSAGFDRIRAEFNQRLDRLVTTEAFAAEQRRVDGRLDALGQDIVDERVARQAEVTAAVTARDVALEKLGTRLDKVGANLKWVASSVLLPIGLFLAGLMFGRP